jgi:hypothetical protein
MHPKELEARRVLLIDALQRFADQKGITLKELIAQLLDELGGE